MSLDDPSFELLLRGTRLAGREIRNVALDAWGRAGFAVDAVPGELLDDWRAGRALRDQTGRWPALSNSIPSGHPWEHSVHPELYVPDGVATASDEDAVAAGRDAVAAVQACRAQQWPPEPLEQRLEYLLSAWRWERVGATPDRNEVLPALSADAPKRDVERWFMDWEERRGPTTGHADGIYLRWFEDPAWLLFLPFGSGAETVAALSFWGQELPGATPERLVAIVESWNRRYGAELVANWGTMLQFVVTRPPQTLEKAFELAIEQT